jgi:hypothetical protein
MTTPQELDSDEIFARGHIAVLEDAFTDWLVARQHRRITGWEAWSGMLEHAQYDAAAIASSRPAFEVWLQGRATPDPLSDWTLRHAWLAAAAWSAERALARELAKGSGDA